MKKFLLFVVFSLFLLPFAVMGQCGKTIVAEDADGNSYTSLKVGPHCWMQYNLKTKVDSSKIYKSEMYPDTNANLTIYGRLYNWYGAMNVQHGQSPVVGDHGFVQGVCPEGWHLPTAAEARELMNHDAQTLHATERWLIPGTNTTGFTMLPGGYYNAMKKYGENLGGDCYMWSAQSLDPSNPTVIWSDCHCEYFLVNRGSAVNGMSVRCVYKIYQGEVTTDSVKEITDQSATLYGTIAFNGYDEEYERGFVYGTDPDNLDQWAVENPASSDETAPFNTEITGLTVATTYYYQAYIVNDFDTAYGEVKSFATKDLAVTTNDATDVKSTSATLNGELTKLEGYANVNAGFKYGTSASALTSIVVKDAAMAATGLFSCDIDGLTANTQYYFKAFAANGTDTVYGEVKNFTTLTDVVTDTIAFVPNGGQGAMDTMFVTRGDTVLNANTYTHGGNWHFDGWNTAADGSGTQYADHASITTSGNLTLYAQWHTWCDGTPLNNELGPSRIDSVKDVDNNKYAVVQIGNQCWLKENLRTLTNGADTGNIYTPTTTGYDVETYGLLYDWAAVMQGESSTNYPAAGQVKVQGICPAGWHVPSSNEWDTLTNYVNSVTEYRCGGTDKAIAKSLAATMGWNPNNNACRIGNLLSHNNATGFSALPAGKINSNNPQSHIGFGKSTLFASATVGSSDTNYCAELLNSISPYVGIMQNTQSVDCISVRCLRDAEAPAAMSVTTDSTNTVTKNGATLYGNVTDMGGKPEVNAGFRYGQHPDYMTFRTERTVSSTGSFNAELTNISPNTTYYFQSYAATATDTAWATDTLAFTTLTNPCQGTAKGNEHASSNGIDSVRDSKGNSYLTVQIGSQCWMAQNLRTETVLGSYNPSTEEERYDVENYGLLYTWDTAAIICPQGWHLPSNTEWNTLSATAGVGMSDEGTGSGKLAGGCTWNDNYDGAPTGAGNYLYPLRDSTGFSALPTGAYHTEFHSFGEATQFWCANSGASAGNAECYIMYHGNEYNFIEEEQTENLISVRCVRDEEQPPFTCGTSTVKDHEGNTYNTVQIGNQCWTRENMRCTTSPSTGTNILEYPASSYSYSGKKAYYVNGSASNTAEYGLLYNWNAAVDTFNTSYGETSTNTEISNAPSVTFSGNRRGICPEGWHVPSNAEWTQLTDYVSSQSQYVCGNNNIAKALASTTGWNSSTVTCAVGKIPDDNNKTGFSALPAGAYDYGYYDYFGYYAIFWSVTEGNDNYAYYRGLYNDYAGVHRSNDDKYNGFSVRCLRDAEVPAAMSVTTDSANTITKDGATLYGNVTSLGTYNQVNAGFKYGTSESALTSIAADESAMCATGRFSYTITGLTANTQYYFKAFAANGTDTVYGEVKDFTTTGSSTFTCGTDKVKDVQENEYPTVQIGKQCWMAQNLRTKIGGDGDKGYPTGASNDTVTYGRLYTWTAVTKGASTNYTAGGTNDTIVHGICPTGWHVPSDAEWDTLTYYVYNSANPDYKCLGCESSVWKQSTKCIANALSDATGWESPKDCGAGSDNPTRNLTGFSAVPAGIWSDEFKVFGNYAYFWSATQSDAIARYRGLGRGGSDVYWGSCNKDYGCSVRCLKD